MLLAAMMLLSLAACSAQSDDSVEESDSITAKSTLTDDAKFYTARGVRYPAELGAPVLGEAAAELVDSVSYSEAAKQITNIGDAYHYIAAMEQFEQPYDMCKVFAGLLALDYDEVGLIFLSCYLETFGENTYCIIYIKSGDVYYPFDPFSMATAWTLKEQNNCVSDTDFDALCERLMATHPYNPNGEPMTSWWSEKLYSATQNIETIPMQKGLNEEVVSEKLLAFTAEEYSAEEIQGFVDANLTLEQAAETFTKPQDAINYLRARRFYVDYAQGTWIEYNGMRWGWSPSAEFTFSHNAAHCSGTANVMNRLLTDDHESQGYVNYAGNPNCHIFNYFYEDGLYFFCDFTGNRNPITRHDYNKNNKYCYILYVTTDPMDFSTYYMKDHNDISSTEYITHLECYVADGEDFMQVGFPANPDLRQYTNNGDWLTDTLPLALEDKMQMLFIRDGYSVHFSEAPPDELRPSEENRLTDAEYDMKYGKNNG